MLHKILKNLDKITSASSTHLSTFPKFPQCRRENNGSSRTSGFWYENHPHPRSDVQNPRNSGLGLRAGLGDPEPYCDCSNSPSFVAESNWRVIIVSLQYLIMMCRKHCQEKGGWRIYFSKGFPVSFQILLSWLVMAKSCVSLESGSSIELI